MYVISAVPRTAEGSPSCCPSSMKRSLCRNNCMAKKRGRQCDAKHLLLPRRSTCQAKMASHVIPRSKQCMNPCPLSSSSETQRNPVFPSDMAAEGTMPGGFMGPQRAPSPQRGAAPPLQHLGNIPKSRKPGTRSLLSI